MHSSGGHERVRASDARFRGEGGRPAERKRSATVTHRGSSPSPEAVQDDLKVHVSRQQQQAVVTGTA